MEITLTLPDHLASRVRSMGGELPRVLEYGLREWDARGSSGFAGLADVLEKLAALPGPEEVLALRPSEGLQDRIDELLERGRGDGLSDEERREWEQYLYVEHLVRIAKGHAALALEGK